MANKKKGKKYSANQLFDFRKDSYLERTSRPIYAILFLLPFIVFYEMGTFSINTDVLNQSKIRVAAFVWLQNALESMGFGVKFAWVAPPLAVVLILIALQITSGKQWRFWLGDMPRMAIECILLAVPLLVLTLFMGSSAGPEGDINRFDNNKPQAQIVALPACSSVTGGNLSLLSAENGEVMQEQSLLANIVTGIGAGIYEELVFRLILICLLMLLFQDVLRFTHKNSIVLSVLISAALFSAHHHIDLLSGQPNANDPFNSIRFAFRTIAGVYFAVLFAIRGFGITAGTHAFYNIIAIIINAFFFSSQI
ncbi:MAG: CPBP family intramembrane metalloprotease [Planctomycetes bacterium]|nr:CPBP family intramembrane metalloprotease [Planctomycetota bacterium]MBL7145157.1 CPBP family intramembrane metalloprotease [Phycisphaerae bacterium]